MEAEIRALITDKKGEERLVSLFGYSTNGLPGLEIVGLGSFGKSLKEKLIYLTRQRQLSIPLKRFVISADTCFEVREFSFENLISVEFTVMVLYWYMAGLIPLKSVQGLVASGRVLGSGKIVLSNYDSMLISDQFTSISKNGNKWGRSIHPEELFEHIPNLSFH